MGRLARRQLGGGIYHVYNRSANNVWILDTPKSRDHFLKLLADYGQKGIDQPLVVASGDPEEQSRFGHRFAGGRHTDGERMLARRKVAHRQLVGQRAMESRHHFAAVALEQKFVVHVSLESKNSLDLNTVRNNVKMVRF